MEKALVAIVLTAVFIVMMFTIGNVSVFVEIVIDESRHTDPDFGTSAFDECGVWPIMVDATCDS